MCRYRNKSPLPPPISRERIEHLARILMLFNHVDQSRRCFSSIPEVRFTHFPDLGPSGAMGFEGPSELLIIVLEGIVVVKGTAHRPSK